MKKPTKGLRSRKRIGEKLEARQMLAADLGTVSEAAEEIDELIAPLIEEIASYDGTENNLSNPEWGAAGVALLRLSTVDYADGLSTPAGDALPSAREVSNAVAAQNELKSNDRYLTDFVWIWGQFIDHDLDLSVDAHPGEAFDIVVPTGDEWFDPDGTGEVSIPLDRSDYVVDEQGVRQQTNTITAYLDGSVVYGSDEETANSLREFESGRLLTSEGGLLPIGEDGFFLAGDVRANENVALTAMHTLWVREHNRLADEIATGDRSLTDEQIYQQARALVTAQIQAITYNQWLPALLGIDAMGDYYGYDPGVNASIANAFSTAAYRFGHSMLSTELLRLDLEGSVAEEGNLSLSDAFFSPGEILTHGIESLLLGASTQTAQEIDNQIVDDVRNFLFGPPGAGGFDLAALNVQRGRDHGLPDYNQLREDYGLERVSDFSEVTSDTQLAAKLEALYGSVDAIDAWVGVLAEDHVAEASLGALGRAILVDQFSRIRSGDRFWYENRFEGLALDALRGTTLSGVIARNTEIAALRENVFLDDSVFYYAAESFNRQTTVMLHAQAGELRLVDMRTGETLASMPQDHAEKVVIVGSEGDDLVLLHPSVRRIDLPGGVVIDGQVGGRDAVRLLAGHGDTEAIDGAFAQFGETLVQVDNVERFSRVAVHTHAEKLRLASLPHGGGGRSEKPFEKERLDRSAPNQDAPASRPLAVEDDAVGWRLRSLGHESVGRRPGNG